MRRILLVRHGETGWNRADRRQGWAPTPLGERGRHQARALGRELRDRYDGDRLYTSDLRRARETADVLREATDVDTDAVIYDRDWREQNKGVLQGLGRDATASFPEYSVTESGYAAATNAPENGESPLQMRERVLDAWRRVVAATADGETTLVVTHRGPIRAVVGTVREWPLVRAYREVDPANGSLVDVEADGDGDARVAGEVVASD